MGKAEGGGDSKSMLDSLKAEEALDVLHRLVAAHPNLKKEAESIARSLLAEVSYEEIADEVQEAVSGPPVRGRGERRESAPRSRRSSLIKSFPNGGR